ncbi:hypothetical protein KC350_g23 [Hortaea werneckii]|nr:hypothetical protein KC350_g23 [Hortaea werneckii]
MTVMGSTVPEVHLELGILPPTTSRTGNMGGPEQLAGREDGKYVYKAHWPLEQLSERENLLGRGLRRESSLLDQKRLQPRLSSDNLQEITRATYLDRLPDLQHPPTLTNPIPAQHTSPALQPVHLTCRSVQVTLLKQDFRPRERSLNIIALGQTPIALLGEHHARQNSRRGMAGHTSVFGEQASLADFRRHTSETLDQARGARDTALVCEGVDRSDSCIDDLVLAADFLQRDELVEEGGRVLAFQDLGAHGFDGDLEVLGAEGGVEDLVPLAGQLVQLADALGEGVDLGETAVALRLDLVGDRLHVSLLEGDFLLEKRVFVLLLGHLLSGFQLGAESVLLLCGAVKFRVSVLQRLFGLLGSGVFHRADVADDLFHIVLHGLNRAGVLNDWLGGLGNVDVVDGWYCLCCRRDVLALLRRLHSLRLFSVASRTGCLLSLLRLRLGTLMDLVCGRCGRIALLSGLWPNTALSSNGHLVLSANLLPLVVVVLLHREAFPELALLKVSHDILTVRDKFGEEVVEVVRLQRIPDASAVAEGGQEEHGEEELAESSSRLWRGRTRRWRRLFRDLRRSGLLRRRRVLTEDGSLRDTGRRRTVGAGQHCPIRWRIGERSLFPHHGCQRLNASASGLQPWWTLNQLTRNCHWVLGAKPRPARAPLRATADRSMVELQSRLT